MKWAPFDGPCQGMPLSKNSRYNRVRARGLLGEEESERAKDQKAVSECGRGEARDKRSKRGVRERIVPDGRF